jgi:superfamily II RNA helicase
MVKVCNDKYNGSDEYFADYSFPLSDFQKHSINGIANNNHVLVTAHTGSGKTLPAEFAIKHWVSQKKKVIYTSPIKALSNQKFYEFSKKFPEITFGLFTGDIKTNPEADVIIMTTEILMNRLFNDNNKEANINENIIQFQIDFEKELAAVVFDEIHYINDNERGQVWEKTLLMLPNHVQMIMLSATMDNPIRFAEWIEKNHENKNVYLCPTNHRVVPLNHYSYYTLGEHELKLIKDKTIKEKCKKISSKPMLLYDSNGKFSNENYSNIKFMNTQMQKIKARINRKYLLNKLTKYLKDQDMLPAIGFVFSRKNVESCAKELTTNLLEENSNIPNKVKNEADQIIRKLPNYDEYLRLPEYVELISLLQKGVGIHHSGMIPILREIVELFISKKYIKVLFATESFAIGLDCPIRTAIFTGITKFDGDHDRLLHSHEYTQMAGRAGRRGIDKVGYIIHCNNIFRRTPTENEYKHILKGTPPKMVSKFRIDYNLIFSVLKSNNENTTIECICEFIKKSMITNEITNSIKQESESLEKILKEHTFLENSLKYLKTDQKVCEIFIKMQNDLKTVSGKKRQKLTRDIDKHKEDHENIVKDSDLILKLLEKSKELNDKKKYISNIENFIEYQVKQLCILLEKQGIIQLEDNMVIGTNLSTLCSHVTEVHSPIWVECMVKKWNYFKDFNVKQIIGLISCVTEIKVKDEYDVNVPPSNDLFLKEKLIEMKKMYENYLDEETKLTINSGIRYDESFTYSIVEESILWCDCENEEQCKIFIQEYLTKKGISLGDFTKAILKISTVIKEMKNLYDLKLCQGEIQWYHKISQVEDMILKYIATNQSLYV